MAHTNQTPRYRNVGVVLLVMSCAFMIAAFILLGFRHNDATPWVLFGIGVALGLLSAHNCGIWLFYWLLPSGVIAPEELQVQDMVGSGYFGDVFRGRWDGTWVAIKRPRVRDNSSVSRKAIQQAMKHEIAIHKSLGQHPSLPRFYGACPFGVDISKWAVITQLIQNGSVEQYIFQVYRRFPLRNLVEIARDVSAGLLHMHHLGVVHRDVAARNILVDSPIRGVVCDFGSSTLLPPGVTEGNFVAGEPVPVKWLAPEALQRGVFSRYTDVFAFGVFMWELFHSRPPWEGMKNDAVRAAVLAGNLLQPPANLPLPLQALMLRCFQPPPTKDNQITDRNRSYSNLPSRRPTMRQVNEDLDDFLVDEQFASVLNALWVPPPRKEGEVLVPLRRDSDLAGGKAMQRVITMKAAGGGDLADGGVGPDTPNDGVRGGAGGGGGDDEDEENHNANNIRDNTTGDHSPILSEGSTSSPSVELATIRVKSPADEYDLYTPMKKEPRSLVPSSPSNSPITPSHDEKDNVIIRVNN